MLKPGAILALGFTPYSGRSNVGLKEILTAAGFKDANVAEQYPWLCALAVKPQAKNLDWLRGYWSQSTNSKPWRLTDVAPRAFAS